MVVVFVDMCSSGESSGYIQTQCNKIRGKIHSQNDRKTKLHMQIIRSLQPNRNNQIHSIFCFVLFSNYEISTKHYIAVVVVTDVGRLTLLLLLLYYYFTLASREWQNELWSVVTVAVGSYCLTFLT